MGRLVGVAAVTGAALAVGVALSVGPLAVVVLGALLIAANVAAARWAFAMRRRSSDRFRWLAGAVTASWLAVSILPAHNFTNRANEAATTSLGLEALVELVVFFGAGLVAVVAIRSVEPTADQARPPALLFLLPIWVVASATWSATGPYAAARGLQMLTLPFLAWATISLARQARDLAATIVEAYLRWFVRITLGLVGLGLAFGAVYVPASVANLERFTWVGAHPNGAGLILSVAIVIILATPGRVLRLPAPLQVGAAAAFLAAMYANHSRTAWLCLALGALVVLILKGRQAPMVRRVGTPLVAFVVVAAVDRRWSEIWDYLLRDGQSDDLATGNGRLQLWGIGFRALETPFDWVGGLGYGNARTLFVAELPWARTAHNSILSLLVSVGVVGVALLTAVVVVAVYDLVGGRLWAASPAGVTVTALLVLVLVNGLATDILAEPNIGFVVLNLAAAVGVAHRLPAAGRGEPVRDARGALVHAPPGT